MTPFEATKSDILIRRTDRDRQALDRLHRDKREREKDEKRRDTEDGLVDMAFVAMQALEQELRETIETYQTATVLALEENRKALEEIERQRQEMLDRAYVMDDGRRVFKSRDGERVFDEFGQQIGKDELDPDMIPNDQDVWEDFDEFNSGRDRLKAEREQLLDYQEFLDEGEAKLDKGGLSESEKKTLRQELESAMPLSVRKQVTAADPTRPENNAADLGAAFRDVAVPPLQQAAPRTLDPAAPGM